MKLRKESWLPSAKQLTPNQRKYIDHEDCGSGRTLVVSADAQGWSAHCFRCNLNGYEPYGNRTLSELQNVNFGLLLQKDLEFLNGRCELPKDFTTEIPDYAGVWLYKAGIFKETAQEYGFGWSDRLQRVVLPVYHNGRLLYVQARSLDRKPKYLNNSALTKGAVLFRSVHGVQPTGSAVITEDILSSVRVGVHRRAVSTLGTQLSDEQAYAISRDFDTCDVWYDGDTAGVSGATKAVRKLQLCGVASKSIRTPKDPKCYSNREIIRILQENECQPT